MYGIVISIVNAMGMDRPACPIIAANAGSTRAKTMGFKGGYAPIYIWAACCGTFLPMPGFVRIHVGKAMAMVIRIAIIPPANLAGSPVAGVIAILVGGGVCAVITEAEVLR